ncbi:lipopolysaccharide heptosyltransferase II [Helicobacter suis]|uniref:lipopolysaccharide heptosyltransferase II n=1 Tax=Helicobacter suis TaxID=104628 RepID=UPI0013D01E71|nr:lipopolysaccharide heptosyltransferase II [Helicobacter suis]
MMKILIRLPNWLGDGVMATPLIQTLKTTFKEATCVLVGPSSVCALFERDLHNVLVIDKTKSAKCRMWATYQLARDIGPCDIGLALTNNLYAALLLYFSKTPIRIGYAKNCRSFLLTHALKPHSGHQVERYYHLLSPLMALNNPPPLKLKANPLTLSALAKHIGISPGAAFGSAKRWSTSYFATLIQALLNQGHVIYLLGSKDDKVTIQEILDQIPSHANLYNLCGQTTIPILIDTIAALDLLICNDSGPMHIATATQTPLIALFGPTDLHETGPYKPSKARLLFKNLPCAPCKKRTCPLKTGPIKPHACMDTIKPEEVIEVATHLLETKEFAEP